MRTFRTAALAALLLVLSSLTGAPRLFAQAAAIVHDKPIRLRHLAGTIVDAKGLFVPYPAVELRDAADHHVIETTFADGNGKFFFADRKRGEQLEIRFSLTGYQTVQYSIALSPFGKERMRAVLPPAV